MKKISILLLSFLCLTTWNGLYAQSQHNEPCGTNQSMEALFQKNPELRLQHQQYLEKMRNEIRQNRGGSHKSINKRIIPVVFHIIHQNGSENITREQCLDQIRILNECYSLSNANFEGQTPACFKPLAADCEIEFRLATKDDQGRCTDGIVRVFSSKTNAASDQNGVKELSHWNSYKYFNIWVVKAIGRTNPDGTTTLGYAQFPLSPSIPFPGYMSTDGIVVRHDCLGSIGTAASGPYVTNKGRVTVHEVGHWLGLFHIWGDDDCGNDNIDDTPIAFGPNYGVCWNNFPYKTTSCNRPQPDTCGEMFMNYMDYSDGQCMSMFTKGQKEVMDFTLSPFSIRGNLWSASNLALTGTRDEDVANPVTCVPIPDFAIQPITTSNKRMVCVGNSVTFSNSSYNAETYTRAWTFEGGTPGTSTATSPQVSYDLPGLFDVSLAATNTVGSATETKPDYILVSPDEAQFGSGPFLEDFNQDADFNNWVVYNNDTTASKWEYVGNGIGFGGGGSAVMRNYTNVYGEKDELISPSYNISSIPNPVLMFRIAGAERGAPEPTPPAAAPIPDVLNLYTSSNCGQSWTLRTNWDGQELASAGQYNSAFVPTSADQWKAIYYPLSSGIANQDNMRFKFEYVAGQFRTNNFYIDDINIGTALGVENLENEIGLRLFPNPVSSSTLIQFSIGYSTDIRIAVIDMLGKEVFVPYTGKVAGGEQAFNIDMSSLSAGIYTIRVELDGRGIHKKVIKN